MDAQVVVGGWFVVVALVDGGGWWWLVVVGGGWNLHLELVDGHGGDAAEDVVVGEPVEEAVDGDGHVARLEQGG